MFNWIKPLSKIIKEAISVEGTYRIGRYNAKAVSITFLVWLVSVVSGIVIRYTPLRNWKFWEGFSVEVISGVFLGLLIFLLLSAFACPILLIIAKNKGWIDKDDY